MTEPDARLEPIGALTEVRASLDAAPNVLKQDIARIKKLLADPHAILPVPIVAFTHEEASAALDLLALQARQLRHWQESKISDAERAEVTRLQAIIPEVRPLIQRLISLATELERRARTGSASPRRKWRH